MEAWFPYILEWGSMLLRWLHVTTAIAWIGSSFMFMHLDASLRKAEGHAARRLRRVLAGPRRRLLRDEQIHARPGDPARPLVWHKWQSYWTWISGFSLLCWVYYGQSTFFLIDPAVMPLAPWQAAIVGVVALGARLDRLRPPVQVADRQERLAARAGRLRLCRADELCLHADVLRPRRAHPYRRADGDDDDRQCLLRHHAQPAQVGRRADRPPDARPEMGQDLQAAFDPQQLHHAARAVHDAVEPLSPDLRQSAHHPRAGDAGHRRRRDHPLFLQHLARRPRPGAEMGVVRRLRGDADRLLCLHGLLAGHAHGARPRARAARAPGLGRAAQGARRCRRGRLGALRDVPCARAGLGRDRRGAQGRAARHPRAYRRLRAGDPRPGGLDPRDAAQQPHRNHARGAARFSPNGSPATGSPATERGPT